MPAKGSSKNPRYRGFDERGYPTWEAECGHIVLGKNVKLCVPCYQATRKVPNFLGVDPESGKRQYRALECGHTVTNAVTKKCRECVRGPKHHAGWHKQSRVYPVVMVNGKTRRVHTLIAEQTLGRPLKKNEVVHHINMDKRDNRRCNLLICDKAYHRSLHHAMELAYARRIVPPLKEQPT